MIAAVLAAVLAAAGCADGDADTPPTPAGFVRYDGPVYSFAHPADWTRKPRRNVRGEPEIWLVGPPTASGAPQGEVLVGGQSEARPYGSQAQRRRFELQLGEYRAASLLTERRIRMDRSTKVPGAEVAHRFEAVGEMSTNPGRSVRMEVIDLYALTEDGVMVNIAVRAPEGGGEAAGLPEVLESFRIKEK
ncbi:hypothetical protein SAMN04489712_105197 [Thermomonospora echinospora]|uniref:Uncharacterized protein n=2 Tax=Thermomonospora echinospora TaxID=1992 RepID=A0A1H6A601_9ACTN|nr:hypothetical protein SAMN04489712_105197 [Thermomonospora echinospora]